MTDSILKILIFLFGLILGHWLSIGRERRKEYNETADIVYHQLRKQKEAAVKKWVASGPSEDEFQDLLRRVSFWQRKGLTLAIKNYKKNISSDNFNSDKYGQTVIIDEHSVINSIEALSRYSKRK